GRATYIDLFCGSGMAKVRNQEEIVDGSAIVAWKCSLASGTPFSKLFVVDIDQQLVDACVTRLQALGAPVTGYCLSASLAASNISNRIRAEFPHGLHFAFVDPFNLAELDFQILKALGLLKRIDMLIHLSAMHLQRNLKQNITYELDEFERFAPKWRQHVDMNTNQAEQRRRLVDYWISLVKNLQLETPIEHKLLTGSTNQPLYWLLLASKHDLAQKFWKTASNPEQQGDLF
ncbi:MAG: three-Cys-motif partner protein TcmP, partial [Brachymonas sp.]|nr:three-Cys-motif partner protein TcmP [Brachymonas sp.]